MVEQITGLVLAGGQGSRLGGVDKGLQDHQGQALVQHALDRLGPQVDRLMISANRNLEVYRQLGCPVWPDAASASGYEGPLAGFLAGLQHCDTPYLVAVPCDCPHFPADLVSRLFAALDAAAADVAIASTLKHGVAHVEPAFCLMKQSLLASLEIYLQAGHRKIERWTALHRRVEVPFDEAEAFFNVNTPDDLARLRSPRKPSGQG